MSFDIIIDWEPYTTNFKGHEITMQLRPLKRWASMLLTPIQKKAFLVLKKKSNDADGIVTEDDINFVYEVQTVAEKIFPDHIKNFEGLTVNKLAVTAKLLCEETIFGPLCIDIISELIQRSQLSEQEEKNLNGPQPSPQISDENTQQK